MILIKKGKYTLKYLFNKNNFIIYTDLNKKYNELFSLLRKTVYSITSTLGLAFYKYGHTVNIFLS